LLHLFQRDGKSYRRLKESLANGTSATMSTGVSEPLGGGKDSPANGTSTTMSTGISEPMGGW